MKLHIVSELVRVVQVYSYFIRNELTVIVTYSFMSAESLLNKNGFVGMKIVCIEPTIAKYVNAGFRIS